VLNGLLVRVEDRIQPGYVNRLNVIVFNNLIVSCAATPSGAAAAAALLCAGA